MGYKLLRALRWQQIEHEPKAENSLSALAPPNSARVQYFAGLLQEGKWDVLLEKSELAFTEPCLHWWFDLQHFACQALRHKGETFTPCAEVIEQEFVHLLKRVPSLAGLRFKDGTPFANPSTQAWIQALTTPQKNECILGQKSADSDAQTRLDEDWQQALQFAQSNKLDAAVALLQAGRAHENFRAQCERKLALARLCFMNKKAYVAESILDALCIMVEAKGLEQWAPDFTVELLRVRLQNLAMLLRSAKPSPTWYPRYSHALEWLARISPSQAISFDLQP